MHEDSELLTYKYKIYRRTIVIIILVFFIISNSIGLLLGAIFYKEFCILNTHINLERFRILDIELERGKKNKQWQDVSISSRLGYMLEGTYLPSPTPSDKTVIFVHGIMANRLMGLWYADIYLDAGYNVLIYDSRAHGDSGGSSVTWGFYEKNDLDRWVDWVAQQHPQGIIGVHGVSMGAATALLHAELNEANKRVAFYVADSAYADLEQLLTQQISLAVRPAQPIWVQTLLKYSSVIAYANEGFLYSDVSPLRAVRNVTTPILYLHGGADALVPVDMSAQLYANTKGYRELHVFPKSKHAGAIFDDKQEYYRLVRSFAQAVRSP